MSEDAAAGDVFEDDTDEPDDVRDDAGDVDRDDDGFDGDDDDLDGELHEDAGDYDDALPLDEHESALIRQDLVDLDRFYLTFGTEGFRGVSVYCHDCAEEHYYPWDMLRENLHILLQTGETPVHEPAFAPDPEQYVPWDYARGYVDALQDTGADQRRDIDTCGRCGYKLGDGVTQANFCPRCGAPLLSERLREALAERGLDDDDIDDVLGETGIGS